MSGKSTSKARQLGLSRIKCKMAGLLAVVVVLSACENGIIGSGENPAKALNTKHGIAQKGPFEIGSNITITSRPAPAYTATTVEQVQTLDDIGSFEYEFKPDTLYDISVTGHHFNELDGQLSGNEITLMSSFYQDSDSQAFVSINILTHITHSRIHYLVNVEGMHPRDATVQASQELLGDLTSIIFAEHLKDFNFSNMSVYNLADSDEEANAVLLFISAAFYQQSTMFNNSRPLSEMLDTLAADLEKDGTIDGRTGPEITPPPPDSTDTNGPIYISSLDFAARLLNPLKIIDTLTSHSLDKIGVALPVPDISFLLDTDADGVSNDIDLDDDGDGMFDSDDAKPYEFEIIPVAQTLTVSQNSSIKIELQFNKPEDTENNPIFLGYDSIPSHGMLTGVYPDLTYTPDADYIGSDSFSYKVNCVACVAIYSGIFSSETVTVTFNVVTP